MTHYGRNISMLIKPGLCHLSHGSLWHHGRNVSLSELDCLKVRCGKSYSLDTKYRWYFQKGHSKHTHSNRCLLPLRTADKNQRVLGMTVFTANGCSRESAHPWDQRHGIFSALSSKSGTNSLNIFPELEMVGISTPFGKKSAPANGVVNHTIETSHSCESMLSPHVLDFPTSGLVHLK